MGLLRIPAPPFVEAITKINDLEKLAAEFEARTGYAPELISHWNPKPEFSSQIERWIVRPSQPVSLVDYVYASDIDLDSNVRARLCEGGDRGILLTPSGTTSVVNVCAYLKNIGVNRIVVLTPAYFTIEAVATSFGMSVSFVGVLRNRSRYELPFEIATSVGRETAIWLTFPVYGASVYFAAEDVAALVDSLPSETIAVIDESLAYTDRSSVSALKTSYRTLRISTPHKALCINGEKISFVTFPEHLLDNMDAWSDCFAGGVGAAGVRALAFIANTAYERAIANSRELTQASLSRMRQLLSETDKVITDDDTDGYFITLYWPSLSASLGENRKFLTDILEESGALPIPSSRNRHPPQCGFCFRVNLYRLDDAGVGATRRLIHAINSYA